VRLAATRDIFSTQVFYQQDAKPGFRQGMRLEEDVMQANKQLLKSVLRKAALAAVALGGLFCFAGAPQAQAREVVVVRRPIVVVRPGFYAPRHEVFVYGWRDRFGCWHRY
jgi:hypothetical protein